MLGGSGVDFYPRSPRGERLLSTGFSSISYIFLSTLPAWGATPARLLPLQVATYFYPRSPRGERRRIYRSRNKTKRISIHAPRVGSDSRFWAASFDSAISIHAPRVGSDFLTSPANTGLKRYFYPRSPRGERPGGAHPPHLESQFLSTLPAWGATAKTDKNNNIFCAV